MKNLLHIVLFTFCLLTVQSYGQTGLNKPCPKTELDVNFDTNCEINLLKFDDSITSAIKSRSTLIVILSRSEKENGLDILRSRANDARSYFEARGYKKFVIAFGEKSEKVANYKIFVDGHLLHKFRVGDNTVLDLVKCWGELG